jgi:hypothetical protein
MSTGDTCRLNAEGAEKSEKWKKAFLPLRPL